MEIAGKRIEIVYEIVMGLYGQHAAGYEFGKGHAEWVKENGGEQCHAEPGLFRFKCPDGDAVCASFVDDSMWSFSNEAIEARLKKAYIKRFGAEFAHLTRHLSIDYDQDLEHGKISFSQTGYIEDIYERFMPELHELRKKPPSAPARKELLALTAARSQPGLPRATPEQRRQIIALIGALYYLGHSSRPDILMAVGKIAQHAKDPPAAIWDELLRVLAYVHETKHHKTTMDAKHGMLLTAACDSDWAVDFSTAGWVIFLAGIALAYASKRERCVALSSTEAELVAASMATAEIVWIRYILVFLGVPLDGPTPLAIDNTGAAAIALDPAMRSALKHVSRRHYFVRDMYEAGEVLPTRIGTLDNIADLFTKPLPPERHTMLAARLRRGSTALAK